MMLPILISVSLAPGSYFFCALAGTAMAAAETSDTRATRLVQRSILSSCLFFGECGKPRSGWQEQAYSARRNGRLLPAVNCGEYARDRRHSLRQPLGSAEFTCRTAAPRTWRSRLSLCALARAEDDERSRLQRAWLRFREQAFGTRSLQARSWRHRVPGRAG